MQADGVFDVLYRLFVAVSLAVATLKRGAGDEIAVGVGFHDDRKSQISHTYIIGSLHRSNQSPFGRLLVDDITVERPTQFRPRTGAQGSVRTEGVNFCKRNHAPAWLVLT